METYSYDDSVARTIFVMAGVDPFFYEIRADGFYLNRDVLSYSPRDTIVAWIPAYDADWPSFPSKYLNPKIYPLLPIPFTARELAACMLDGPGSGIQYWLSNLMEKDPRLTGFSMDNRAVVSALQEAQALLARAMDLVGDYDRAAETAAHKLNSNFADALDHALDLVQVMDQDISRAEYLRRLAEAKDSVRELEKSADEALAVSKDDFFRWRKRMVWWLLGEYGPKDELAMSKKWAAPKLNLMQQKEIVRAYENKEKVMVLAKKYGVSRPTIDKILIQAGAKMNRNKNVGKRA